MTEKNSVDKVVKRHRDFWNKAPTDRPLLGFPWQWEHSLGPELGLKTGPLTPEMLDPELFVACYEDGLREGSLFEGDLFRVASAHRLPWAEVRLDGSIRHRSARSASMPWMSAIMGCEIEVSSQSIWANPLPEGQKPTSVSSLDSNRWLAKAIEITKVLNQKFAGTYPTAAPQVSGPADMVAALLGSERLCLDMIDDPEKVTSLAQMCTDVWLEIHTRFEKLGCQFYGGYCDPRFQMWAPGMIRVTQDDCALFFSPSRYNEILMPVNRRTFTSCPYSIMHVHSAAAHTFELIYSISELGAIQIHVDPVGPSVSQMMPTFAKIQQMGRRLIIFKEFTKHSLCQFFNYQF